MNVRIKKLRENAIVPEYQTPHSAGFDLHAALGEPYVLGPMERGLIGTGIAIAIEDEDTAAFCFARSGLSSRHGICLANGVGVIDSDYRGEIMVSLINLSGSEYKIMPGDRIAQVILIKTERAGFIISDELPETIRRAGGFGSTGR